MKTAVSLPDELFQRAERAAERLGTSRSALYAEALRAYLLSLEGEDDVTAALNDVYAEARSRRRSDGAVAGRRLVDSGDWEW